ncbi:MAG: sporulation protein YqfD [Clostridia bacterium]|nr:sporulation protein YqfD [Clostridia bacterium]
MELEEGIKRINGTIEVQIEGFFTERFINLCKINNIKIWNIKNILNGMVRFNIAIKDFKSLKKIAKKTKCKVKIISKKGMYFKWFKLRKRKLALILLLGFLVISVLSTKFVWKIDIVGNTYIATEDIYNALEEAGLYVGRNKFNLKTKKIINSLRVTISDIAWVGIDIDGTHAVVNIVEKTKLPEESIRNTAIGDIVSNKSGIIQKIVAENGTPILSVGDYVEEGRILIEGKVYSEFLETKDVPAQGEVYLKTNYEFKKDYEYNIQEKEYTDKVKYSIGVGINDKENYINYLDKSLKYDIIKSSSDINLFGNNISFSFYTFKIYNLKDRVCSKDEIISTANVEAEEYFNSEILPSLKEAKVINKELFIDSEDDKKVTIRIVFDVVEKVGYFKERN